MILAVGGNSDAKMRKMPPLHYSLQAPDLIDVCRFNARKAAANAQEFDLAVAVGVAGETLGAALDSDDYTRVLVKKKAAEGEQQLYTDNYLIQVATETGIKTVMARPSEDYESELFALDEKRSMRYRFVLLSFPMVIPWCMCAWSILSDI